MKPHLLLDITCLGFGFDHPSRRRGVERQVIRLFDGFRQSELFDLSFVATASLAGVFDFLVSKGIDPSQKLRYLPSQLSRSRIARRRVNEINDSKADRRWMSRFSRKIRCAYIRWLTCHEGDIPAAFLDGVNLYHTPHTPFPLPPFPPAVQKHSFIKKIVTIHDLWPHTHPAWYGLDSKQTESEFEQIKKSYTEKGFAFCMSQSVRADILEHTCLRPERIFLAQPAADPESFFPVIDPNQRAAVLHEFGIPGAPYFLALSVPEHHKNFAHLLRCMGTLARAGKMSIGNVVIVGRNASNHPSVKSALSEHPSLVGRVFMPGYIPDEKLAAIYSGATAFLFPSLAEGFGLPPLEAMQCGVPVISSNTTAMPEVIGDAGILLAPTDVDAWCGAMVQIAGNRALQAELAAKSLQRARLFSWDKYLAAVTAGYQAILDFKE